MRINGSEKENRRSDVALFGAVFAFVCQTLAASVEVFLHRRFGERYLGLQNAAVIPLVLVWIVAWPEHDPQPLLMFLALYLVMCVPARLGIAFRGRRHDGMHSRYTGRPRIIRLVGRLSELSVKQYVEPLIVFGASMLCFPVNEPLGAYLLAASFGLGASAMVAREFCRARAMDMNDAYIEQQHVVERFRDMRGD